MIERFADQGMRVRVYRNLHANCFAVKDVKTGRVVAHAKTVSLRNAKFVVRKAGRERVLSQKKKNVHAFVVGEITSERLDCIRQVKYNPYVSDKFIMCDSGLHIEEASFVFLHENRIFV